MPIDDEPASPPDSLVDLHDGHTFSMTYSRRRFAEARRPCRWSSYPYAIAWIWVGVHSAYFAASNA